MQLLRENLIMHLKLCSKNIIAIFNNHKTKYSINTKMQRKYIKSTKYFLCLNAYNLKMRNFTLSKYENLHSKISKETNLFSIGILMSKISMAELRLFYMWCECYSSFHNVEINLTELFYWVFLKKIFHFLKKYEI